LFNRLAGHHLGSGDKVREQIVQLVNERGTAYDAARAGDLADEILHIVRGQLKGKQVQFRDCIHERSKLEKSGLPEDLIYLEGNTIVHHHGARPVSHAEMKDGLDTLLALGVLRLGIERRCPHCEVPSWFHVDTLTQRVTCPGCGTRYPLGATEFWSYALNSLAQMSVLQGALAVLHALTVLASQARTFFAYSPSLDLFRHNVAKPWHEVDIACILDGQLVIGEVKDGTVSKKVFDDLGEVAEALRPQRVIVFLPSDGITKQQEQLRTW